MKLSLKTIRFEGYRNIEDRQFLRLEQITVLVGANESGKSNLIRSVCLLEKDFTDDDVKIGSRRQLQKNTPKIEYFFLLKDADLITKLAEITKNFKQDDYLVIVREGKKRFLKLGASHFKVKDIDFKTQWRNTSGEEIKIKIQKGGKELTFPHYAKIQVMGKNKIAIARLARAKKISPIASKELERELLRSIEKSLPKIEEWRCEESKHYLPDFVYWQQLDSTEPVKSLSTIASKTNTNLVNLPTAYKTFEGRDTDFQDYLNQVSDAINSVIKKVWKQSEIEIKLFHQTDKLRIDIYEGGKLTRPSVRSEGLKWFISFLLYFEGRGGLENKIILLDQPGDKLHPGGQKELRARFEEVATKNQIIYSTQSPFLVDRNYWNRVQFLWKNISDAEIRSPSREDIKNDELLRLSLGYTLADVGQANDWNIVVEGYFDKYLLLDVARRLNEWRIQLGEPPIFDFNKIAIFDRQGRTSIHKGVDGLVQAKLEAIGIYDGDIPGKNSLKEARKDRTLEGRFHSLDELLDELVEAKKLQTIEDLIPQLLWNRVCNELGVTEKFLSCPRLENLKEFYKNNLKKEFTREDKEKIWQKVLDGWDGFFGSIKDISRIKEIKTTERLLKKTVKILADIADKRQ